MPNSRVDNITGAFTRPDTQKRLTRAPMPDREPRTPKARTARRRERPLRADGFFCFSYALLFLAAVVQLLLLASMDIV